MSINLKQFCRDHRFPTNQTKKTVSTLKNVFLSDFRLHERILYFTSLQGNWMRNETKYASVGRKNKERVKPMKAETKSWQLFFFFEF